jgi:hypothetical protein
MTCFERIASLWQRLLNIPRTIIIMFGPPPFDGYPENVADPGVPAVDRRDPKETPIAGDIFAGPHGGVRHFRGFNPETNEAEFTRADRPSLCREPRAKWFAWVKNATIVAKNERL